MHINIIYIYILGKTNQRDITISSHACENSTYLKGWEKPVLLALYWERNPHSLLIGMPSDWVSMKIGMEIFKNIEIILHVT